MKNQNLNSLNAGLFLLIMLIFSSCRTHDHHSAEDFDMSEARIVGVVHKSDECGFYIESTSEENKVLYMPDNLEEKFRIEGMKLKFGFKPSQTKLSKTCNEFKPVLLSEVDAVRW